MVNDYFIYKTHCELAIVSNEIEHEIISKELNIVPSRVFRKGDLFTSKNTTRVGERTYNLWAIESKSSELLEESVSHHIEYFRSIILSKVEVLKKYKKDARYEVTFWIWIETDNSGIGLDLDEKDMCFLSTISNRVHLSLITK